MKMLKKLALVSAVSMISAGAFAMEAMDDESMSATTGQDGITILVSPGTKAGVQLAALGVSVGALNEIDVGGTISTGATKNLGTNGAFKGLSIKQVVVHDNDGWTTAGGGIANAATEGTDNSGALVIGDGTKSGSTVLFADDTQPISIDIDMVGDNNGTTAAGGKAMLNVRIKTPTLAIKTGKIYVADSFNSSSSAPAADITTTKTNGIGGAYVAGSTQDNTTAVGVDGNQYRGDLDSTTEIMGSLEVVMGSTTLNIQLGAEAQTLYGGAELGAAGAIYNPTAMILVDAKLTGGLALNNVNLKDRGGLIQGGDITVGSVKLTNNGGTDLDALVAINVEDDLKALNANYAVSSTSTAAENTASAAEGGLVITIGGLGGKGGDGLFGPRTAGAFDPAGLNDDTGVDIAMNNIVLGSGTAKGLGDVQLIGLDIAGTTMIIRGH